MSTPKAGDRVKVEYTGTVLGTTVTYTGELLRLRREDGNTIAVSAEYVTVIEPAYETGSVYQDANGIFYMRKRDGWIFAATGAHYTHDYPTRPLRKMVPGA